MYMANFVISGTWKNENQEITHYAIHAVDDFNRISKATKMSKLDTILLLDKLDNYATTMVWNYIAAKWTFGEKIQVIDSISGKYLRTISDNKLSDNLGHLINYNWIY